MSVLGLILAAGAYFILFGVLIPLALLNGFIGYNVIDPILGLFGAVAPAAAPVAPALQSAQELKASEPASIASEEPADLAPAPTGKRNRTERTTPTTSANKKGRMSTDTDQSTNKTTKRSTMGATAEPTDGVSTPKPAKPATRRGQPGTAERGALDDADKTNNPVHRGKAGHPADSKAPKSDSSDTGGADS